MSDVSRGHFPVTATGVPGLQAGPDDSSQWCQADRFQLDQVAGLGADGQIEIVPTPLGVALISLSCDVPHAPKVQVAPIVELTGENAQAALDGKPSQYGHLPALGSSFFADLGFVATVSKAALAGRRAGPGVVGDLEARRFSVAVARQYDPFSFPDWTP